MKNIKTKREYLKSSIFILFFFSYYFYFLSLEKCLEGEDICCKKSKWMKKKIIEESISCILMIILVVMIIKKKISKFHFIHIIIVFFLFYVYSHGIYFDDHGYYNIQFYFIIVFPISVFLYIINYLLFLKKKQFLLLIFFLILLLIFSCKYFIKTFVDCSDWEKGLNNTSINNDKNKYGCLIKIPESCPYKIGKYFLDNFKNSFVKCYKDVLNSRNNLLKFSKSPYINKDTFHIGFPLINKEERLYLLENFYLLRSYISENLIDMNNLTLMDSLKDKIPEVSVDFSNKKIGEIKVNLRFNKTLSEERKKLEKFINPFSNNILVLYIDSVSRANSIRQLKKTLKFFEKFMSYKGNYNLNSVSENFHSFQFFKYHAHKFYTPGNYPILFFGNHRDRKNKYINLYLKKNGFITAYSADSCYVDFVRSLHNFTSEDIYDHQYTLCDPNFKPINLELKCFYGNLYLEHMFEYMDQFWRKYKSNRKFSLMLTNFAHENSLELLKYMDNRIYKYFHNLFKDDLLKDTTIFLLSDHGVGLPSIYYLNKFYRYEEQLPMLYLLVNDRKNESYESQYKFLFENQQAFITGFDIYNTLIHIIFGKEFETNTTNRIKSKYGESLFTKIDSKTRNPKKYISMESYVCQTN